MSKWLVLRLLTFQMEREIDVWDREEGEYNRLHNLCAKGKLGEGKRKIMFIHPMFKTWKPEMKAKLIF